MRQIKAALSAIIMSLTTMLIVAVLGLILFFLLKLSYSGFSLNLWIRDPNLNPTQSGIRAALVGHGLLVLYSGILGTIGGIWLGIFLNEWVSRKPLWRWLIAWVEVLTSLPSIVVGAFAYAVWVKPVGNFNGLAGVGALTLIMIPLVASFTFQSLQQASRSMVEAAFALGASPWQVLWYVKFPAVKKAVLAGVMISLARITGETAPLLFTSFNKNYLSLDLKEPLASLTVTIYNLATSPYPHWQTQAWAACAILVTIVTTLILMTNLISRR